MADHELIYCGTVPEIDIASCAVCGRTNRQARLVSLHVGRHQVDLCDECRQRTLAALSTV